jgi:hypothetical protein
LQNGKVLCQAYPHLFSFTTNESITLQVVLEMNDPNDLFQLPLSEEAYVQFYELQIYLQVMQGSNEPVEIYLGQWSVHSSKGLQDHYRLTTCSSCLQMDLAIGMSTKT